MNPIDASLTNQVSSGKLSMIGHASMVLIISLFAVIMLHLEKPDNRLSRKRQEIT